MKGRFKKFWAIMISTVFLISVISNPILAEASNMFILSGNAIINENTNENINVLESPVIKEEITINTDVEISDIIPILYEYKQKQEKIFSDKEVLSLDDYNENIYKKSAERKELVNQYELSMGVEIVNADINYSVENATIENNTYTIQAYEYILFEYTCSGSDITDISGYGIMHTITISQSENGYLIVADEYIDDYMLEYTYVSTNNNQIDDYSLSLASANYNYDYSPNAAVAYADTWVPHSINGGCNPSYYNPAYTYYSGNDCANYVSQCLYAGGMSQTSTWKPGVSAWTTVAGLRDYFNNYGTNVTLTSSNIKSVVWKGCPLYIKNSSSSHVVICTGYASDGWPYLNGHTNDRYHQRVPTGYYTNTIQVIPYKDYEPVTYNNPDGYIDNCSGGSGSISVRGWAFDRDDTGVSVPVHVYIGGPAGSSNAEGYAISANVYRPDVNTQFGVGDYHGYDAKINTNKTGTQEVYIYACNAAGGGENVLIEGSPKTVNITPRASILDSWLSESDMGSKVTECEKGKSYYLCYKMYDTNSGEYFNSYSNLSYTVRLTFYDKNGSEIGYRNFTKVDSSSIQFTAVEAGTCSYKVTLSGDLSGEVTQSFVIKDTAPQTYKVTYNANGGQNAPASQTKTENVDLKLTTQKPTRTGYEFYGWGKTATTNTASYSSGGTYKDNASITLYAVWIPIQYIVKYNANGGSGEMNTQLFLYDTAKNLSANTFTRTNYTFKNWNTKADGSGVSYSDGASVKNLSATKGATFNLYAIWNGISVTGVNLNKTSLSLKVGGTSTLTATVLPSNATNKTVSWKSSNTSVATVSNGVVTAKAVGTATITAVTSDGNKTATCSVTVTSSNVAVTSISLNKTSTTLDVGKTETLTATVLPSNATNKTVSWTSSNTSVATVSNGVVTAKSAGTATITAKTADGSKTATCTVKVNSPVDENAPKVQVKNVIGKAGNTVNVVLKVENNPGIAVLGFKVGYDSSAMTLQSVTVNDVFSSSDITAGDISKNPYTISAMSAAANIKANGNLVTLTFKIKDNCNNGVYAITLTEPEAYNINEQTVTFTLVNGTVTVKDVEPGDITGDGSVNRLDLLRLGKYLADWDVEISEAASDVTGDGNVNRLDLLRLGKFLADWDVVLGQ